jgi:hypothetical protein
MPLPIAHMFAYLGRNHTAAPVPCQAGFDLSHAEPARAGPHAEALTAAVGRDRPIGLALTA